MIMASYVICMEGNVPSASSRPAFVIKSLSGRIKQFKLVTGQYPGRYIAIFFLLFFFRAAFDSIGFLFCATLLFYSMSNSNNESLRLC